MPRKALLSALFTVLILCILSCSPESESPYDAAYIEFRLDPSSPLGYDDLQSIKIFVDPYAAFNLLSIYDDGRSVLGAYDFNSETVLYMGFEYSPLYTSRVEDLSVAVTTEGGQEFIDSPDYMLHFFGELPSDAAEKPYVQISVSAGAVSLTAVQGAAGSPVLTVTETLP